MDTSRTESLLIEAIKEVAPKEHFGLLFSGGIDSLMLAFYLKKLGYNFTCYTASLKDNKELEYTKEVAKSLNLNLKHKIIETKEIPKHLKKIIPELKQTNPVNVAVALTTYIASELAKKDKVNTVFSGLGADEIFGGYSRHKESKDLNKDLKEGLGKVYNDDLKRDEIMASLNKLEIKAPFLEKELVDHAIKLPKEYKINKGVNKFILRELALKNKIKKEYALKPKKAAQYSSKFDKAIEKLAKKQKLPKSRYLYQFFNLGILFSSGKDSCYATHLMKKENYTIKCLITIKSKNPDSYMYHTPNIDLTKIQAKAMALPIILQETTGKKEVELKELEVVLKKAKEKYNLQGIVTGALFSDYQRERIEKIADKLSLKVFSPLWHRDQETEMRELVENKFKFIFTSIAADGLDKKWLNKVITNEDIDKLVILNKKIGLNIAGEGGEFESLVLDCPLFNKKLEILETETIEEDKNTAKIIIKKAKLSSRNKSI